MPVLLNFQGTIPILGMGSLYYEAIHGMKAAFYLFLQLMLNLLS